ncbi:MAG TPA: enoyl-CoA hydratase/isomerase family protein [Mesorhizobium sp.]|jgi:enoyl-CoA hydratase|nr:enoyl-CoA hydratase/isomerase family protein [Mesorhizobium sp.]
MSAHSHAAAEPEVIVGRENAVGVVRLNRPKALNALTLSMVRAVRAALEDFSGDPAVALVILEGAGERAFSAGGDIRTIHERGKIGDGFAEKFWAEEYELDALIARFPKPVVAIMHGIVMGGGAGLAIHASHRIVTDSTRFAFPEVGIGFIPDVGASWLLPRAPGQTGRYLAFTGESVRAADVIRAGLSDTYVPASNLAALRADLLALPAGIDAGQVSAVIDRHRVEPPAGLFAAYGAEIDAAFRQEAIEDILAALDDAGSEFAAKTIATIRSRSPTSLRLAAELLRLGRGAKSLEECLLREFHAACLTLKGHDFYEGVRAAVIDKDRNPRWSPPSLAEAPPARPEDFAFTAGVRPPAFPSQEILS